MFRGKLWFLFSIYFGLSFAIAAAQDASQATEAPTSVDSVTLTGPAIASGLNNPRHIFFGSDGTLYIAEAGTGGDTDAQGPYGAVKAGQTAQISAVSPDGKQSVVLANLASMDAGFGQIEGPTSVTVTDDSYWLTLGMGTKKPIADGVLSEAVVQIDRKTGQIKQNIDLGQFENDNNPDEGQELVSNPVDLAFAADGTLYIVDASGNSLLTWTATNGLKLFKAWIVNDVVPQDVPTSVAVGPDGDIYVGFLSGFPYPPKGTRIERYSPDGTLKETYKDLTLVTDVLVTADGTLYAVEMASGFSDNGYNPDSGRVVKIVNGKISVVLDGLNYPYGIAQDKNGNLFVTVDSAFAPPNSGSVVPVGSK